MPDHNASSSATKSAQRADAPRTVKKINLALQGGGAHGAYCWGVLDKLLEDGRLEVEAITATSAGTMNACAFAYGQHLGGRQGAREKLYEFWWNVHLAGKKYSPIKFMPWQKYVPGAKRFLQAYSFLSFYMLDSVTRLVSPYQLNPFDINPLRKIVHETIDFNELRQCKCIKLFISATHVRTGKVRIFNAKETTLDVAMASACLPYLYKAVTIDGEAYWDGGYVGNPALFPLFYETDTRDVLIVHLNPLEIEAAPTSGPDIVDRLNEISFNSSLLHEMRAIAFVKKLLENDMLKDSYKDNFKEILLHSIRADEALREQGVATKFDTGWSHLTALRDRGRAAMADWLDKNYDNIGERDSVDLHKEFLYSVTRMFSARENTVPTEKRKQQ